MKRLTLMLSGLVAAVVMVAVVAWLGRPLRSIRAPPVESRAVAVVTEPAAPPPVRLRARVITDGLRVPVFVTAASGSCDLYVLERRGTI